MRISDSYENTLEKAHYCFVMQSVRCSTELDGKAAISLLKDEEVCSDCETPSEKTIKLPNSRQGNE